MDKLTIQDLAGEDLPTLTGIAHVFKTKVELLEPLRVEAVKLIVAKLAERTELAKLDYFLTMMESDATKIRLWAMSKAYAMLYEKLNEDEKNVLKSMPPEEFLLTLDGEKKGGALLILEALIGGHREIHGRFHSVGHTQQALEFFSEVEPKLWNELSKISTNVDGKDEPLTASVMKSAIDAIMYRWNQAEIVEYALKAIKNIMGQPGVEIALPNNGKSRGHQAQKIADALCFALGGELENNGWKEIKARLSRNMHIDWKKARKNAEYFTIARKHYLEVRNKIETEGLGRIAGLRNQVASKQPQARQKQFA